MRITIADAAISLVPQTWLKDKKVRAYHQKFGRLPLVNATDHQHLLKDFPKNQRLDRPDILHFGLLTVLGYSKLLPDLEVYFTCQNGVYQVDTKTNLPRSQKRFYGILENLLSSNESGPLITKANQNPLTTPHKVVFSTNGRPITKLDLDHRNFVFGGFGHGTYQFQLLPSDVIVCLSPEKLELWTALSRFLNLQLDKYS